MAIHSCFGSCYGQSTNGSQFGTLTVFYQWKNDINIPYVIRIKHTLLKFHLGYVTIREIFLIEKHFSYHMLYSS